MTYPQLIGKVLPATHELHVFMQDLNPNAETLNRYYQAVDEWNSLHPNLNDKMKACYLALVFRDPNGGENTVKVMQSARYLRTDDMEESQNEIHNDAAFFASKGLPVIREKIEATAYGILGIPETDNEALAFDSKYFEFHIKVGRANDPENHPLSEEEVTQLKTISALSAKTFKVPVPLSYNCNKDGVTGDGKGHQRFLNVRFRHQGMESIKPKLLEVSEGLSKVGLRVIKTISEYVWFDTFPQLDIGWID